MKHFFSSQRNECYTLKSQGPNFSIQSSCEVTKANLNPYLIFLFKLQGFSFRINSETFPWLELLESCKL